MSAPPQDDAALRDSLAVERTRLANERTLLSYLRTALALFAGGGALLQLFANEPSLAVLAWVCLVAGAAIIAVGAVRFLRVRARLARLR